MAPTLDAVARRSSGIWTAVIWRIQLPAIRRSLLAEEFHRVGVEWDSSHLRIVDVARIYHQMEPRNLSAALKYYCGREHEGAHDALADVEATADVLIAQLERYPDQLQGTVGFLGELSGDRKRSPDAAGKLKYDDHGAVCLAFGKYNGWPLSGSARTTRVICNG
ncbi:MAG: hypothetical protein IPP83_10055 [Flavobacteriales bacterium]|nr:hypothetical protein [Flavobacteriales bacterium]